MIRTVRPCYAFKAKRHLSRMEACLARNDKAGAFVALGKASDAFPAGCMPSGLNAAIKAAYRDLAVCAETRAVECLEQAQKTIGNACREADKLQAQAEEYGSHYLKLSASF